MDVKEAVEKAKKHVGDLFTGEEIRNLGLEEADYDDSAGEWRITVGFSRPWDAVGGLAALGQPFPRRTYKIVRISDATGEVTSVRNREVNS